MSTDRYDPLPGLTEIPGFLIRKLTPRGRRVAAVLGAAMVALLVVVLVVSIPKINETKHQRAATDRRTAAEADAELTRELKAEQRLRQGVGTPSRGLKGTTALAARTELAAALAASVEADATARVRSGEFGHPILRVECERYPRAPRSVDPATVLSRPRGRYSCLAITADAPETAMENASSIGYPYRALVNFPKGRFTYCKVSGVPGEGSFVDKSVVHVPVACGGERNR